MCQPRDMKAWGSPSPGYHSTSGNTSQCTATIWQPWSLLIGLPWSSRHKTSRVRARYTANVLRPNIIFLTMKTARILEGSEPVPTICKQSGIISVEGGRRITVELSFFCGFGSEGELNAHTDQQFKGGKFEWDDIP